MTLKMVEPNQTLQIRQSLPNNHHAAGPITNTGLLRRRHRRTVNPTFVTARASDPPKRRRDARERYKGYSFVFATDCYHNEDVTFGRGTANSVSYIKPLIRQEQHDSLRPVRLPYFFTGFQWTDENDQPQTTSRLDVCHAWQVGFNQLLYYGSIVGEMGPGLSIEEHTWVKEQFSLWDDLFTEIDEALGRLTACERQCHIPDFSPSRSTSHLANPYNRTSIETGLDSLSSTFLAAATECNTRTDEIRRSPSVRLVALEQKLKPWEPCRGHPVVHTSSWSLARINDTKEAKAAGRNGRPHRSGLET